MLRLRHKPGFWLGCSILWFVTLCVLSSFSGTNSELPPIDNIDKVAHFGYFFGGGGLLTAYLYKRKPHSPDWSVIILTATLVLALVGVIDEFHQSFTPGRSGNDVFDWLADVSGSLCGALVFRLAHRTIK